MEFQDLNLQLSSSCMYGPERSLYFAATFHNFAEQQGAPAQLEKVHVLVQHSTRNACDSSQRITVLNLAALISPWTADDDHLCSYWMCWWRQPCSRILTGNLGRLNIHDTEQDWEGEDVPLHLLRRRIFSCSFDCLLRARVQKKKRIIMNARRSQRKRMPRRPMFGMRLVRAQWPSQPCVHISRMMDCESCLRMCERNSWFIAF